MNSNFSRMPSLSISRSKFLRKSQHKTSMNLGELVPIYVDEVLPGDTRKIDIGSLIRMSTPVAPIMDNIFVDLYAFFVPNRLTWSHWKEFMGENNSSAGIYSGTAYTIPKINIYGDSLPNSNIYPGCLGHHMGLPLTLQDSTKSLLVSCLPIRGYRLIYNRFFRDQNVIAPYTVNTGDTASAADKYNIDCFKVAKVSDYFTRALPYAQKGAPVTIPLSTSAPIVTAANAHSFGTNPLKLYSSFNGVASLAATGSAQTLGGHSFAAGEVFGTFDSPTTSTTMKVDGSNLVADLSQATAATINQIRFAFQYQKLLEKDCLFGTRYWELIKAHFSVTAPDASLQDPELLGHRKIYVNVDQVVQTTGINQSTPASNQLGATAAVSVTGDVGNIFSKSFTEHGHIIILACARHDQTYSQGVDRMWSRSERTDFYFPVFANLGAQTILNKEIFAQGNGATSDEKAFGFQEAWAEYRYKPSKASGLLDPAATNSLGYWTLTNKFMVQPTLGSNFIQQDRNAIGRVLQTGSVGPDFIAQFTFRDTAVRPMPLYSIPGLIDHH